MTLLLMVKHFLLSPRQKDRFLIPVNWLPQSSLTLDEWEAWALIPKHSLARKCRITRCTSLKMSWCSGNALALDLHLTRIPAFMIVYKGKP